MNKTGNKKRLVFKFNSIMLPWAVFFMLMFFFSACNNNEKRLKEKELVADLRSINDHVSDNLANALSIALKNDGKINDSLSIIFYKLVDEYYNGNKYLPIWSDTGYFLPRADSLMEYFDLAARDGLFKEDYHFERLKIIRNSLVNDSLKRRDAVIWAKADLLLTDAFMHIAGDLSQGRLQSDSISWRNDTSKYKAFFFQPLNKLRNRDTLSGIFNSLQPNHKGYRELKAGLKNFMDSMDTRRYTYLDYPFKAGDEKDSLKFINKLQLRLSESDMLGYRENDSPDSLKIAAAIKKYQQQMKIKADGKLTASLVKMLNLTDVEKYYRIAVTLDRYKQIPLVLPEKYVWVNLPGYYLQVYDTDTVSLTSRIICGKPVTPTPILTSLISDIIIYPTWTVPESIIKKEMLPALKRNSGYLARKGLNLYNYKGEMIDPSTVNWAKYSKGIPYKIQQGSGDDNALGVIKFNFSNPYSVYLHDTNQRYLFKNASRALSHGCVRVQDWDKLSEFIVRNDSARAQPDTLKYNTDSIGRWIAQKEKHRISVKFPIPLFIGYFSCEGEKGKIKFYDDIYSDDRRLIAKYLPGKL